MRSVASAFGGFQRSHATTEREVRNDVRRIRRYFDEVWSELRKVSWPTRLQVRNLTVLVFAISLVVGIYIALLDAFFQGVIALLVNGVSL